MVSGIPAAGERTFRVLVVDDNKDAADTLAVLVKFWGYECQVTYSGPNALHMAQGFQPDCLLLDIDMPRMNGCAVARAVRQQPDLAHIKLVALTALSDPASTQRIQEAGFDHHLIKPADIDDLKRLLAMMEQVLRLASQTEELARQNVALASETKDLLHGVKEQIDEVKDKLEDVTQEVKELKKEIRDIKDQTDS
jgi:two-component system, OmpR family, response regulator